MLIQIKPKHRPLFAQVLTVTITSRFEDCYLKLFRTGDCLGPSEALMTVLRTVGCPNYVLRSLTHITEGPCQNVLLQMLVE